MITKLGELWRSQEFQIFTESKLGNDLFINDPERANRIHDAAEHGCDGSTHAEHIEDWQEFLDDSELPDEIKESIQKEIDACEAWHAANGSLHTQTL